MTDHINNMAEDAPIRVRYKHIGVDAGDGVKRSVCRPSDLKLQLVADAEKATCPHCKARMEEFYAFMEMQKALGNLPE